MYTHVYAEFLVTILVNFIKEEAKTQVYKDSAKSSLSEKGAQQAKVTSVNGDEWRGFGLFIFRTY